MQSEWGESREESYLVGSAKEFAIFVIATDRTEPPIQIDGKNLFRRRLPIKSNV